MVFTQARKIACCRCRQLQLFEKMGGFLLKLHRSAKSLDPNRVRERTLMVEHPNQTSCDQIRSIDYNNHNEAGHTESCGTGVFVQQTGLFFTDWVVQTDETVYP